MDRYRPRSHVDQSFPHVHTRLMPRPTVTDHPLDELVAHTVGPQPWRRLVHALTGTAIAGALSLLPIARGPAVLILGGATLALYALDVVRLRIPAANVLYFKALRGLVSPREVALTASSTWYALGATLSVALFTRESAVSGILVLALSDAAASYAGRRWGRRPFLGGTVEGSVIFGLTAFMVLALRHPPPVAAAVASVCCLAERLSWPLDDNLTVPVVGAAAITVLQPLL